ncbi:hypothetical protein IKZ80_07605 [bacterium]|nr:hypothetical protein [bacterium]
MKAMRLTGLLAAALILTACEPSPKEAAELFVYDLKAGNWKGCASFFTPELREAFAKESESWPILAFAQTFYTDGVNCEFLKYETKEGKAHTLISYTWRWLRVPIVPGSVYFDLVWRPMDGKWRIENIYATSHWDMLPLVCADSPKEIINKAQPTTCGLRYVKPYRESESWESLGRTTEQYLETWYR